MISLAGRDIQHAWGKFVFTGIGLGLLIGVTLSMAGIYRGMVEDAKVLLNRPPVILADEPTAPLDSERAMAVITILNQMAQRYQTAVIVVTHDEKIIPTFRRIYHIRDGRTEEMAGEGCQPG